MARGRGTGWVLLACAAWLGSGAAAAAKEHGEACDRALAHLPARPADAPSGSAFVHEVAALSESAREGAIEARLLSGDLPRFLTRFVPVELMGPTGLQVTLCVAPDYLAIGTDQDFLYVPMRLSTALRIAGRFGALLPTAKIVDAVYDQADLRLAPQPLPPTEAMRTTAYYAEHNALVQAQRNALGATLGDLVAGDKKDLVLTERLWRMADRVAIYGWHRASHEPIQPLSTVHGWRYADYSHGVRLVGSQALVDGRPRPLVELLSDPAVAPVLNGEGAIEKPAELVARLEAGPAEAADGQ